MCGYYVYMHISPSGKKYVGITKQKLNKRWKNGYGYTGSPHFYNAILKYGWDNFEHLTIAENLTEKDACELEKSLIANYNLTNREFGYNECDGGEGTNGYHHTDVYKERLRNRPISDVQKRQISNTLKKRWKEGRFANTPTFKRGAVPWNKGLTKDDPRVAKAVRKKGEWHPTEEMRRKLSESQRGRIAPNRKKVVCVETGVVYASISEASKLTGANNIGRAVRLGAPSGHLHWRFVD